MFNKIKILIFLTIIVLFAGCALEPNHSIRVKNLYQEKIKTIKIGTATFNNIDYKKTTEYKPIDEGNFSITGSTETYKQIYGSGTVTGKGTHKWTLIINSSGTLTMQKD
jgi:uncharacterized protein YceK